MIPLVMAAPEDIMILMEGSEARRKVMDLAIVQIDRLYLEQLNEYQKVLEHRNRLLKQITSGTAKAGDYLETWDERLHHLGTYIFESRKKYFNILGPIIKNIYNQISDHQEQFELEYQSAMHNQPLNLLLKSSLTKDLALERTTEGVHRDDYIFHLNGNLLRKCGSQGQQKTFVFALKLALYQFLKQQGTQLPILLLDDIFEKLDESRSHELIKYLSDFVDGQIFITDTHASRIDLIVSVFQREANTLQLIK
jgi:DNA replication and repair protein RecF